MIKIEYSTWNNRLLVKEHYSALPLVFPRKGETVTIQGNDYRVEKVFHEPEHDFSDSEGRPDECHKVTVKLEYI